jgi:hypothetical protein
MSKKRIIRQSLLRTRLKARTRARPKLTKVEQNAILALAELRNEAPYYVSFRCEPTFAIDDESKPIRLVAEFSAIKRKPLKAEDLEPVVCWLDRDATLKRVGGEGEASILRFEAKRNVKSFTSEPTADDLQTKPVVLLLYPNKNKEQPAIAMFKLTVLKRTEVNDARRYMINELLDEPRNFSADVETARKYLIDELLELGDVDTSSAREVIAAVEARREQELQKKS